MAYEAYECYCYSHLQDVEICYGRTVSCQIVPNASVFLPSASQNLTLHDVVYRE